MAPATAAAAAVRDDITAQLDRLIGPRFLTETPSEWRQHLPRYLKAMQLRLDKYGGNPARDDRHAPEIAALWKLYAERADKLRKAGLGDARLEDFRWQIEELRVSLFAQELKRAAGGTPDPVIIINADAAATHQSVINIMEAARIAGYGKITFTTQAGKK